MVAHLWPRGLTKERATIDHWIKEVAPTPELRRWYAHQPDRWPEFQKRYRVELEANLEAVTALIELCLAAPVTFVFAAQDTERNSAVVLKDFLENRTR